MRIIEKIIFSSSAPDTTNTLWIDGKDIKIFGNNGWSTLDITENQRLYSLIQEETIDRKEADKQLLDKINEELSNREEEDEALREALATETQERQNADNTLDSKITQEIADRKAADTAIQTDLDTFKSTKGEASGLAPLNESGKVDSQYLPSFVDDVVDVYATYDKDEVGNLTNIQLYSDLEHQNPIIGEAGKIYQNIAEDEPAYQFRWTGTIFTTTGSTGLIIGEVTGTAYDGGKGKHTTDVVNSIPSGIISDLSRTPGSDSMDINMVKYIRGGDGTFTQDIPRTVNIPAATKSTAGVMSSADKQKLDGLKEGSELETELQGITEDITNLSDKVGSNTYTDANYISKETNLTDAALQLDEEIKATNDNLAILNAASVKSVKVGSNTNKEAFSSGVITIANATTSTDGALSKEDKTKLDNIESTYLPLAGGVITGTLSVAGNTTLGNVTITGNVTQQGDSFITEAETVQVKDNLLVLNNGEVGAGVTAGISGIEVDRGTETNYQFIFDESDDYFKVGEVGNLQTVLTRDTDANLTANNLFYWDNTTKQAKTRKAIIADLSDLGSNWDSYLKAGVYNRNITVNGTSYPVMTDVSGATSINIYAPKAAGTAGQFLKSTGSIPTWANLGITDVTGLRSTLDSKANADEYLPLTGGTLTGALHITSGGLNVTSGRIRGVEVRGEYITGKTLTNALLSASLAQVSESYSPYFAAQMPNGDVVNIGGIGNRFGIYGYDAARTENGQDWLFEFNSDDGSLNNSICLGSESNTAYLRYRIRRSGVTTEFSNSGTALNLSITNGSTFSSINMTPAGELTFNSNNIYHAGNLGTITFTGAVSATYNGQSNITVNIPQGGGVADSIDWSNVINKPTWIGATKPSYSWSEISSKPSTFTPSTHTHTASQVTGLATVATSGSYNDLTNKPSIPGAYTLPIASADTLGGIKVGAGLSISSAGVLSATGGEVADSVDWDNIISKPSWVDSTSKPTYTWSEISGKPSSFTPSAHTHDFDEINFGNTGSSRQYLAGNGNFYTIAYSEISDTPDLSQYATQSYVQEIVGQGGSVDLSNYVTLDGTQTITGTKTFTQYTVFSAGAGTSSDKRLKRSIKPIENPFEILEGLTGYRYTLISNNAKSAGLIAQDVEKVLPEAVRTDDEGYKSVDTYPIVAVLVETIKELKKEIEELKSKL